MATANIAFRKFKPTIENPLFLSVCATGVVSDPYQALW